MKISENKIINITELLNNNITADDIRLAKRFAKFAKIDYNKLVGV